MLVLPECIIQVLDHFAPVFSRRVWQLATVLLVGAILAPGKRTVSAALRVMGLSDEARFGNYPSRAESGGVGQPRAEPHPVAAPARGLCGAAAPIVLGIDETLERRWGAKITARGIYRDAVRSSKEFFVKSSGLRWISLMLLACRPLDWRRLGTALLHSAGALRALPCRTPGAAQEE